MCAIAGLYDVAGRAVDPSVLERMVRLQAHRGPDGEGYVLLDARGREQPVALKGRLTDALGASPHRYTIALGHRRLAIVDLSPLGHQPMATEDGRCWVTYNGEIYNYVELREELRGKGHRFRSASDTEVLLAAYREWGEACVTRFNGMFAFAIWDGDRRRLFCARDRLGVKPFYYAWDGVRFAFASEIKGLLPVIERPSPNQRAVFDYLEGACLDHSEDTFFEGIRQLPPAHTLTVETQVTVRRYWDFPAPGSSGLSMQDAAERFRHLFRDAVRLRLRSDVPIGTCLSGGLDSSSIVCVANDLMFVEHTVPRELIGERQKTFSSCFEDPAYDERQFIRSVVEQTGAEAHYTFPDPKELAESVSQLVWRQDEPFGSTSIFAQWNVMRLAAGRATRRQGVAGRAGCRRALGRVSRLLRRVIRRLGGAETVAWLAAGAGGLPPLARADPEVCRREPGTGVPPVAACPLRPQPRDRQRGLDCLGVQASMGSDSSRALACGLASPHHGASTAYLERAAGAAAL